MPPQRPARARRWATGLADRKIRRASWIARSGGSQVAPKTRCRVAPAEGRLAHGNSHVHSHCPGARCGTGSAGRRDRRAIGAPRRRHRPPPRPDPRVRHPRGLEHRLHLLRRLAELAGGARPRRGPRARASGARPGHAAAAGPGPRPPLASATREWSTSMPRSWRTRISRASPSSRTAHAFQLERPRAWRATPAGWSCGTAGTAALWRSMPGRGPTPFGRWPSAES